MCAVLWELGGEWGREESTMSREVEANRVADKQWSSVSRAPLFIPTKHTARRNISADARHNKILR